MAIDATVGSATASSCDLTELIATKRVITSGYLVVAGFILAFGVWGSTMPLTKAAVVSGVVGVEGQKKVVQHLDGGIVDAIHVKNGDVVSRGQPLVTLNPVDIESRFQELLNQKLQLSSELARWQAELKNTDSIAFPDALLSHTPASEATRAMQTQESIRQARHAVLEASLERLDIQRELAAEEQTASERLLQNQLAKQSLVTQELQEQRRLERSGLVTRADVFELEKDAADLVVEIDEARARIISAQRQREQVASASRELQRTRTQEAAERSTVVANDLSSITQQVASARNELERTRVLAPVDGYVLNSQLNTVGGVVTAGQPLMEIMPRGERLLIESRVDAGDRDTVRVGQSAQVRFTALNRRATPPVDGVVRLISADRSVDPSTQQVYYNTSIELLEDPAIALSGIEIYPGMLTDVLIVTGEQTLLHYILSPILRSFDRALREE